MRKLTLYDDNGNKISELNITGLPADISMGISENTDIVHFLFLLPDLKIHQFIIKVLILLIFYFLVMEDLLRAK